MSRTGLRIVHTESSCGWGGQEVRILTESRGMLRRDHQVQLICCPESEIARRAGDYGVPVTTLPIQRRNIAGLFAVRKWLTDHPVDIVNTHSSFDSWLFTLAARAVSNRPRIVRTRHLGAPVKSSLTSNWLYSRGADFLITCGDNMRQALIEDNGVSPERSVSIPTGIELAQFQPGDRSTARQALGLPQKRIVIGIVAALRKEKGHQYLCESVKLLDRPDVDLLIVGGGPSQDLIARWVAEYGLAERTHLVGHQANVTPYLQAMDLFVLPTWAVEGVPQSIVQAMSCERPVISTTVGSVEQAVEDGVTGRLVPPRDARALCEAMRELLDNRALSRRFAEAGRAKALAEFGLEKMLDRTEAVLQTLVSPRRRAA
jgi:glycosyltransferase involved in cell wall biosynthesis